MALSPIFRSVGGFLGLSVSKTVWIHIFLFLNCRYIEVVQANAEVTGPFETTEFEYSRNSMSGSFDFRALEGRLIKIKEALLEEHTVWIRLGEAATVKGSHSYDCQQIQMALQVRDHPTFNIYEQNCLLHYF
jgi:hypothetical protein